MSIENHIRAAKFFEEAICQTVYAVSINTDLTEGRGHQYIKHICTHEATARRLAKGADVQRSDGIVFETLAYKPKDRNFWWAPGKIEKPTPADLAAQAQIDAYHEAKKKATEAGLTKQDLIALTKWGPT